MNTINLGWYWSENKEEHQLAKIPEKDRNTHFYVIGATGTGKTKFLEYLVKQDIEKRNGFGVIDPHGDQRQLYYPTYCLTSKSYHKRIVASTKILLYKLNLTSKSEHRLGLLNCIFYLNRMISPNCFRHILFILSLLRRYGFTYCIRHYRPELG